MSYLIIYDKELDCLWGRYKGVLDKLSVIEISIELKKQATIHNCNRVISDFQNVYLNLSNKAMMDVINMVSQIGIGLEWKRAIVVSKNIADYSFYDNLAIKKGHSVKVFTDEKEAMKWMRD